MSTSFDRLIDGMIDALRAHVLPNSADDFARGQLFSVIFALNGLKLNADWKAGPLLEQVRVQDSAFAAVRQLARNMEHPDIPATPRADESIIDPAHIEARRDEGDRKLGELLFWATGERARAADPVASNEIERLLRRLICDQLKVEIGTTPRSMLLQIATGEESIVAEGGIASTQGRDFTGKGLAQEGLR
jgi:hypothetical protein